MMPREYPILVPHSDHGDPECCGIVMPVIRGDLADLTCNECGAVIATVAAGEAEPTLLRMAAGAGICSEMCPHCGDLNVFPGFTEMLAYTCRYCGEAVRVGRSVQ